MTLEWIRWNGYAAASNVQAEPTVLHEIRMINFCAFVPVFFRLKWQAFSQTQTQTQADWQTGRLADAVRFSDAWLHW